MLGEKPCDCAVVEDAESGMRAVTAGGFYAIAISDARKFPLADLKIDKLSDLLK